MGPSYPCSPVLMETIAPHTIWLFRCSGSGSLITLISLLSVAFFFATPRFPKTLITPCLLLPHHRLHLYEQARHFTPHGPCLAAILTEQGWQ